LEAKAKIVSGNALISYGEALEEFNKKLGNQMRFITFIKIIVMKISFRNTPLIQKMEKNSVLKKKDGIQKIADRALKKHN
jgi:hypothetical protein